MAENPASALGFEPRPPMRGKSERFAEEPKGRKPEMVPVPLATIRLRRAEDPTIENRHADRPRPRPAPRIAPRFAAPAPKRVNRWTKLVAQAREANLANETLRDRHESLIQELRLAEQVQRSMLPRALPQVPRFACGASLRPCLHLAGDFYNVIRLDRDRLAIYLGDVMGHGPAAALLGVFAMQGIRTKRIEGHRYDIMEPSEVLSNLNQDMIRADFPESPFVTMAYAVLDTSNLSLSYACGGHPPILLLREGEPPVNLERGGALLGVFDMTFEQERLSLRPGDRFAFYSDGVESARWGDQGEGIQGLTQILSNRDGRSPQEIVDGAMALAQQGNGPSDDLTLVLVEVS